MLLEERDSKISALPPATLKKKKKKKKRPTQRKIKLSARDVYSQYLEISALCWKVTQHNAHTETHSMNYSGRSIVKRSADRESKVMFWWGELNPTPLAHHFTPAGELCGCKFGFPPALRASLVVAWQRCRSIWGHAGGPVRIQGNQQHLHGQWDVMWQTSDTLLWNTPCGPVVVNLRSIWPCSALLAEVIEVGRKSNCGIVGFAGLWRCVGLFASSLLWISVSPPWKVKVGAKVMSFFLIYTFWASWLLSFPCVLGRLMHAWIKDRCLLPGEFSAPISPSLKSHPSCISKVYLWTVWESSANSEHLWTRTGLGLTMMNSLKRCNDFLIKRSCTCLLAKAS